MWEWEIVMTSLHDLRNQQNFTNFFMDGHTLLHVHPPECVQNARKIPMGQKKRLFNNLVCQG